MKNFFTWVKPSFEDKDGSGRASIRRLTAMLILLLYSVSRLYYTFTAMNAQYLFYALVLDSVFFCVLMGIILIQHILEFRHGFNNEKNNQTNDK